MVAFVVAGMGGIVKGAGVGGAGGVGLGGTGVGGGIVYCIA